MIRITPFNPDPVIDSRSREAVIRGGVLAGRIKITDADGIIMREMDHKIMQKDPPGKNTPPTIWACGIELK